MIINRFYIKAKTFKESFDNFVESDLIHYIKDRYQYKTDIRLNIEMLDDAPADYHFICPALDLLK